MKFTLPDLTDLDHVNTPLETFKETLYADFTEYIAVQLMLAERKHRKSIDVNMKNFFFLVEKDGDNPEFSQDYVVIPFTHLGYHVSSYYRDSDPYLELDWSDR